MRFSRILLIAILILGVAGLTFAAVNKRPPVNIVEGVPGITGPNTPSTGVQGSITLLGALQAQLKTMTCGDITVYVGKYTTPPPPPGGLGLSIPTFQKAASHAATGGIPACSYKVTGVPAGQEFEILVNANQQKFACDQTSLIPQPPTTKLTFTKGKMETRNFQVTPNCAIIK